MDILGKYHAVQENRSGEWPGNDKIACLIGESGMIQVWNMSIYKKQPIQLTLCSEQIWWLVTAAARWAGL